MSDEESGRTPLRFERVVLLMDPDADGIHIGALFVLYLLRWAPALIRTGRVHMARAPMFILTSAAPAIEIQPVLAFHPAQCRQLVGEWTTKHGAPPQTQNVRGLGSLPPALLSALCVDPATRRHSVVTMADAQAVVDVFGAL
jgi:DNA gyrase subunit B/topoisomerase-4 subunit B